MGEMLIIGKSSGDSAILPDDIVFCDEEDTEASTSSLNADTVGGYTVDLLLDKIYPVGSIYMSLNSANPATLFGGIWEQIKDTFLLAAGDTYAAGSSGGEAEVTLSVEQMPSHNHKFSDNNSTDYRWSGEDGGWANFRCGSSSIVGSGIATKSNGGDQPHNNMPPYLTVYTWQRVS